MKYWIVTLLILVSSLLLTGVEQTTLTIATGNKDGVYFKLGKALETILENDNSNLNVVVLQTSGSNENAELIRNKTADIAFMQNDTAYNFSNGSQQIESLRGLASLYTEVIQIVGKKDLFIQEISDLQDEPVAVGEINSGTLRNAIDILRASNLKDKDIIQKNLAFSEIKNGFLNNEISVAFITAGLKFSLLEELSETLNFIPLSKETLLILRDKYPYFVATTIPAHTYSGQSEPINAAGVKALLVTSSQLSPQIAEMVCSAIFSNKSILKEAHPIAAKISLSNSKRGMTLKLHEGATKYYNSKALHFAILGLIILLITALLMLYYKNNVVKTHKYLMHQMRQNVQFRIGVVIVMLFVLGSIGSYYFEHSVNDQFDTIYKSFWASIVYLLSGFEIEPFTTGGRFSAFLLLLGGMGILGTVIGNIAANFMKEGVEKMPKNLKRHIAICNWSKRGEKVIEELHHPTAEPDTSILVLTDAEVNEKELRENSNRYANVYFIKGKPTAYKTLEDARVHLSESVIILSDPDDKEPDPKTILTCLAIRQLCKEQTEKHEPHIIAELMDRTNRQISLDAGANEIVSAGFYRTGIMLQSARYHNLSDIFHELLIYEDNTSSIFIIESDKFPEILDGKNFQDAAKIFNNHRNDENPVILIGVRRICIEEKKDGTKIEKAHVILNPRLNAKSHNGNFDKFQADDALVVIAQAYPDLSKY
jgi:uncharacterized protein